MFFISVNNTKITLINQFFFLILRAPTIPRYIWEPGTVYCSFIRNTKTLNKDFAKCLVDNNLLYNCAVSKLLFFVFKLFSSLLIVILCATVKPIELSRRIIDINFTEDLKIQKQTIEHWNGLQVSCMSVKFPFHSNVHVFKSWFIWRYNIYLTI